jgi:hypothetical protein
VGIRESSSSSRFRPDGRAAWVSVMISRPPRPGRHRCRQAGPSIPVTITRKRERATTETQLSLVEQPSD